LMACVRWLFGSWLVDCLFMISCVSSLSSGRWRPATNDQSQSNDSFRVSVEIATYDLCTLSNIHLSFYDQYNYTDNSGNVILLCTEQDGMIGWFKGWTIDSDFVFDWLIVHF
jgi:hypothetical protein